MELMSSSGSGETVRKIKLPWLEVTNFLVGRDLDASLIPLASNTGRVSSSSPTKGLGALDLNRLWPRALVLMLPISWVVRGFGSSNELGGCVFPARTRNLVFGRAIGGSVVLICPLRLD